MCGEGLAGWLLQHRLGLRSAASSDRGHGSCTPVRCWASTHASKQLFTPLSLSLPFCLSPSIHPSIQFGIPTSLHLTDNVHLPPAYPTQPPTGDGQLSFFPTFHTFHHQQDSVRDSDGGGGGVLAAADGRTNYGKEIAFYSYFLLVYSFRLWLWLFFLFSGLVLFWLPPLFEDGAVGWMDGRTGLVWVGLVLAAAARWRVSFSFLFSLLLLFSVFCLLFLSYHSLSSISISFDFLYPTSLFLSLLFSVLVVGCCWGLCLLF